MRKFELIIKNKDGSIYWTEGFETKRDANTWLKEEKTRPYWDKSFSEEIIDNTKALAEVERLAKVEADKLEAAQKAVKKAIKDLRDKKGKTLEDSVALLEKIVDYLGI